MVRLPTIGGDKDQWGQELIDYMQVEHNDDGTHKIDANLLEKAIINQQKFEAIYADVNVPVGRTAVALRFDDGPDDDYSVVYPALLANGLVGGFAVISSTLDTTNYLTTAQAQEMQLNGMEIMCHSKSHSSPPASYATFYDEIVTPLSTFAAAKIYINSFVQPGTWTSGPYYFTTPSQVEGTQAGRLLRAYYAAMLAYVNGNGCFSFPTPDRYGSSHITPSSLSDARRLLYGGGGGDAVRLLFHSADFGSAGNLTAGEFATFCADVAAYIAAGEAVNITPTALQFARHGDLINKLGDPGFEASATGAWRHWIIMAGTPTVEASGVTGNCASVKNSANIAQILTANAGRSWRFHAKVKRAGAGSANAVAYITNKNAASSVVSTLTGPTVTLSDSAWTDYDCTFGSHPDGILLMVRLHSTNDSPGVLWDDVRLTKI